ncbi:MAG: translational machinery protein [Alphaproteobacteria bacterium]
MAHFHAVVWLDHREAHVFHLTKDDVESRKVRPTGPAHVIEHAKHLHHRSGTRTGNKAAVNRAFFDRIVEALDGAKEWLVCGPGAAKTEFVHYLHDRKKALAKRVMAIETADHPSDKQVIAHARKYFRKADRLLPQRG